MTKKTILVAPMFGVGHVNATIGIAECLRDRGHKVVYLLDKTFAGQLKKYGFDEEVIDIVNNNNNNKENENMKPGEEGAIMLKKSGMLSGLPPIEKMKLMGNPDIFLKILEKKIADDPFVKDVVERINPDIILLDDFIGLPSLIYANRPWVSICSGNPLFYIGDENLPPGGSGLATDSDRSEWQEFKKVKGDMNKVILHRYNQWMAELGLPSLEKSHMCIPDSPYLNIYGYPQELDYTDVSPIPKKWIGVDAFVRGGEENFELPEKMKNRAENEKLVYLSMGSMGCIDTDLMKRLVDILAKSPHKFIVSKGLLGDKYELPDNMWGQNVLPQTKVLPFVDLVITHGGNNTVTEAFNFGKPMIVLPLFGDQFDNGQRLEEKGFGIRLEPYSLTDKELLGAIDKLLNDKQLKNRLDSAKQRIAESKSILKACQLIETLAI